MGETGAGAAKRTESNNIIYRMLKSQKLVPDVFEDALRRGDEVIVAMLDYYGTLL